MKKKFLMITVFLVAVFLAQFPEIIWAKSLPTEKGSVMISGGFSCTIASGEFYESDGDSLVNIQLKPSFSLFIFKGFAIGVSVNYERASQGDESYSIFAIGPQIAYFFGKPKTISSAKGSWFPYLGMAFLYETHSMSDLPDLDYTKTAFDFSAGVCYMISPTVGIFTECGYSSENHDMGTSSASGNILKFIVGLKIFL